MFFLSQYVDFGESKLDRHFPSFFHQIAIMQESKYRIRMNDERRDVFVKSDSITVTFGSEVLIFRLLSEIRLVLRLERRYG